MKSTNSPVLAPRAVPISAKVEVRFQPVGDTHSGAIIGVDCRLWRRVPAALAEGAFAPTGAGLRFPVASLRQLATILNTFASELEAPPEQPGSPSERARGNAP